jgi:hypothetical protein
MSCVVVGLCVYKSRVSAKSSTSLHCHPAWAHPPQKKRKKGEVARDKERDDRIEEKTKKEKRNRKEREESAQVGHA